MATGAAVGEERELAILHGVAGVGQSRVGKANARERVLLADVDDGRGISAARNMPDLIRSGKLGLIGMKERAELAGGTFELRSDPGGGTTVAVRVKAASR